VIEKELQVVLNILTKHDYQNAFTNGRSTGNSARVERVYLEGDGGQQTQTSILTTWLPQSRKLRMYVELYLG
jgi:hypothetical protein